MSSNKQIYSFGILLAIIVNIFSLQLPFFWDTILTSTITQYWFEHGFSHFIAPPLYDAGHPPLFYIYVTGFYQVFGKNLIAAHLSMLPFTIIGILSFIRILQHFSIRKSYQWLGVVLFFSVPAVITQYMLVSYDAVLLSLYLAAIVAYLKNKKLLFAIVIFGITGITLRGLFCVFSLSLTIYFFENKNLKQWIKWNLLFLPALVITCCWYYFHYSETGWFFSTNAEGWIKHRGIVSPVGLVKNSISILRCFFDLGMIIVSLLSLFYIIQKKKADHLTLLWLIPAIVFTFSFLPFSNPVNHRYFLIVYVLMLIPVIRFLSERKVIFAGLTILILLLGHFQIYPVSISNGWDCTLVHISYLNNKKKMFTELKKIDKKNIGTVFPMNASQYQTEMKGEKEKWLNIHDKSIDSLSYVLYSNIGNDFSDEQIRQIKKWIPETIHADAFTEVVLFKNPAFSSK